MRREAIIVRGAAELAIIIAGVLVALWIDGWHDARVAKAEEQGYLERLEGDLITDSTQLAGQIEAERSRMHLADTAALFSKEGWRATSDTIAVLRSYHFAGFVTFFVLETTTWDDLVATGNLSLLHDTSLRQRLGAYYKSSDLLLLSEMDDNRKQQVWYRYRPALDRYFPERYLNRLNSGDPMRPFPPIDFQGLRRDPAVIAGVKSSGGLAEVYARTLGYLAADNEAMLALVREARGHT